MSIIYDESQKKKKYKCISNAIKCSRVE